MFNFFPRRYLWLVRSHTCMIETHLSGCHFGYAMQHKYDDNIKAKRWRMELQAKNEGKKILSFVDWNLKLLRLSTNFKASLDDLKNKANFLGGLVDFERMMAFTPIICHKRGKPTKIVSINYCTFSWVQLWLVMYIQMLWLKAWGYDSKLSTMQPAPAPLPFSLSTYLVKLNWNFIFGASYSCVSPYCELISNVWPQMWFGYNFKIIVNQCWVNVYLDILKY